jgi:hypothetical protein
MKVFCDTNVLVAEAQDPTEAMVVDHLTGIPQSCTWSFAYNFPVFMGFYRVRLLP